MFAIARKKSFSHRDFESKTEKGKFTKICNDMMESVAWQALSRSQISLYLTLKSKYTAKVSSGMLISDNARDISMPTKEAAKMYSNLNTFRNDIDALIEAGFIDLVQSGWNTRTANIYGLSDRWKKYGQPNYEVPVKYLRKIRNSPSAANA